MKKQYRVTDAISVRPVVTRYQMVEEIKPPKSSVFTDFIFGIVGLIGLFCVGCFIFGFVSALLGYPIQ